MILWAEDCSDHILVVVRCSLVEKSTVADWRAAAGQSPADTEPAVDCTESYLKVHMNRYICQLLNLSNRVVTVFVICTWTDWGVNLEKNLRFEITVTSFIVMLGRFIKRPLIALLSIWRLWIWVLSVTCGEHDSTHAKTPVQNQNPRTCRREIRIHSLKLKHS